MTGASEALQQIEAVAGAVEQGVGLMDGQRQQPRAPAPQAELGPQRGQSEIERQQKREDQGEAAMPGSFCHGPHPSGAARGCNCAIGSWLIDDNHRKMPMDLAEMQKYR